jgi:hypothetical protein
MSGSSFRHLAAFRISFWNNQIGSEGGVFGDQKASSHTFSECPMAEPREQARNEFPD